MNCTRGWLPDQPAESLRAQFISQLLFGAPGLPVDQRHDRASEPLLLAWSEQSQDIPHCGSTPATSPQIEDQRLARRERPLQRLSESRDQVLPMDVPPADVANPLSRVTTRTLARVASRAE